MLVPWERRTATRSRYVDVFISHKIEDAEKAKDLKRRTENFGVTCWIDANDKRCRRSQV
jgi:hypothetical protein